MTAAPPPRKSDLLAMSFTPEAASALRATNDRVARVRSIPHDGLSAELRDDRDRLLTRHLPDLLAAHREARRVAKPSENAAADAELSNGLHHVGEELDRIVGVYREQASGDLAVQSRFLEQRYPADALGEEPAVPVATPQGTAPERLGAGELSALFDDNGGPLPAEVDAPPRETSLASRLALAIPIIIAALILLVFQLLPSPPKVDNPPKIALAQLKLSASIDSIKRSTTKIDDRDVPTAVVKFHGSVENRSKLNVERIGYLVDVSSCPSASSSKCTLLGTVQPDETFSGGLPPGLSARVNDTVQITIPDVEGTLRASIRFDDANGPFDEHGG